MELDLLYRYVEVECVEEVEHRVCVTTWSGISEREDLMRSVELMFGVVKEAGGVCGAICGVGGGVPFMCDFMEWNKGERG